MSVTANLADRTVAVVLAGVEHAARSAHQERLQARPALRRSYRCIDFSLSNCVNSGVRTSAWQLGSSPTRCSPTSGAAGTGTPLGMTRWSARGVPRNAPRATVIAARRTRCIAISHPFDPSKTPLVLVLAGDHIYKIGLSADARGARGTQSGRHDRLHGVADRGGTAFRRFGGRGRWPHRALRREAAVGCRKLLCATSDSVTGVDGHLRLR